MQLNEGEVICSKCEGKGCFPPHIQNEAELQEQCPKCHGDGKVDWVTSAMGAIKKRESLFHKSVPILSADPDGEVTFYLNGKEVIKATKNGFHLKGKKVADDKKIYNAFVQFLKNNGVYK